jgi:hypothetical protein
MWASANQMKEIYLLDPSLEQRPDLEKFLDFLAVENKKSQIPFFVELRAEYINKDIAQKLFNAGIREIETGLQTISAQALKKSGRKQDLSSFIIGIKALKNAGVDVKTDIMFGLPGDCEEDMKRTLHFLLDNDLFSNIQAFRTQVLPGTRLRDTAKKLEIQYDFMPPYIIRSTPGWPEEKLEESFLIAEKTLGINLAPPEKPVMRMPDFRQFPFTAYSFPHISAVYFMGTDLDCAEARKSLLNEEFAHASATLCLYLKADDPNRYISIIKKVLSRFVHTNPFSSLTLIFECAPQTALDAFEQAGICLRENLKTKYLERFYSGTIFSKNPQRRIFCALDAQMENSVNLDWISQIRDYAEVIWIANCSSAEKAIRVAGKIKTLDSDFLFLNIPGISKSSQSDFFRQLLRKCKKPHSICLPALDLHWEYERFLESKFSFSALQ